MTEKTNKQRILEVHQVLLGIEGTEEKGLVGEVKEINTHLKAQNASILKNTILGIENKEAISGTRRTVRWIMWIIGSLIVGGGVVMEVISLL